MANIILINGMGILGNKVYKNCGLGGCVRALAKRKKNGLKETTLSWKLLP